MSSPKLRLCSFARSQAVDTKNHFSQSKTSERESEIYYSNLFVNALSLHHNIQVQEDFDPKRNGPSPTSGPNLVLYDNPGMRDPNVLALNDKELDL